MEHLGSAEEEGWIQFNIYCSSISMSDVEEWRQQCVALLLPYTKDYLWHMDPFCLRSPDPSDSDYTASSECLPHNVNDGRLLTALVCSRERCSPVGENMLWRLHR